jgi:hypothetical protein
VLLHILDQLSVSAQTLGNLGLDVSSAFTFLVIVRLLNVLLLDLASADHRVEILAAHRHEVADQDLFLVLVTPDEGDVLPDKGMSTQMSIDLSQLDPETSDLDLVVGSSGALNSPVRQITTEITRPVHSVSDTLPVFALGLVGDGILALHALAEPVHDKLFLGSVGVQVALGQTSRSDVDLSDLSYCTWNIPVGPVDDQKLHVNHTLSSGHDVLLVGHESAILADGRDGKVRDGTLGLGGTVHIDDSNVRRQRLQTVTVSLGKNVSDKEGVLQGRDLPGGLGR